MKKIDKSVVTDFKVEGSDIIQVGYFKLTHGKRFFKMAPLHHHFEMCGWNERKVVAVFTIVSAVGCLIAYFGVAGRFFHV